MGDAYIYQKPQPSLYQSVPLSLFGAGVCCAFTHSGRTCIVMERIKGDMVCSDWLERSEESKAKLLSQLKAMILEMRELQPPDNIAIASVDGR